MITDERDPAHAERCRNSAGPGFLSRSRLDAIDVGVGIGVRGIGLLIALVRQRRAFGFDGTALRGCQVNAAENQKCPPKGIRRASSTSPFVSPASWRRSVT